MFVRIILESSLIELSIGSSDIPVPVTSVEFFPLVVELLTPPEKNLNFWDSNLAYLTRIDISLHNQLEDPNKYIFAERALVAASTGEKLNLSSVAHHSVEVLAIGIFGFSSLP